MIPAHSNPRYRIGTSGWVYQHWRGVLYAPGLPQSRWYARYSEAFDTVEINYSFYTLPSEASFDRWREQAPEGFVYALKGNRLITHVKRLRDVAEPLARFLERARRLGNHLGPILWQLPPHWDVDTERLASFVELLPGDLNFAFEFRDKRWFAERVRRILESHNLAFCIFDMPGLPCPMWVTADVVYIRFHGSGAIYGGLYGPAALRPWAANIRRWAEEDRTIYAYFNNDACGFAVQDARTLKSLLAGKDDL